MVEKISEELNGWRQNKIQRKHRGTKYENKVKKRSRKTVKKKGSWCEAESGVFRVQLILLCCVCMCVCVWVYALYSLY